jgi:hypothetical protein
MVSPRNLPPSPPENSRVSLKKRHHCPPDVSRMH